MSMELSISDEQIERLPPQSLEAEQAVLSALLVMGDAITRVLDILHPDYFYRKTNQIIYAVMLDLFERNEPIDIVTVSQELKDQGKLETVGGRQFLADLAMSVATTANLEYYAHLVHDKAMLRGLIKAGTEIVTTSYEETDADAAIDKAERLIFSLAENRDLKQLVPIADIVGDSFAKIEERYTNRDQLAGVPSGFYDLDAMTSGFQASDLIIVAARPSMGKCLAYDSELVLGDGSIATIEEIYKSKKAELLTLNSDYTFAKTTPSAFIDDGIKPVFKVTTRLGRSIETTLTHPFLTFNGWQKLKDLSVGDKIAVPRHINVFGKVHIENFAQWLDEQDFTTSIPTVAFTLNRLQLAELLSYLINTFCTAESAATNSLLLKSKKLGLQLQHLLLRFDILSALRQQGELNGLNQFVLDILEVESITTINLRSDQIAENTISLNRSTGQLSSLELTKQTAGTQLLERRKASAVYWDQIVSIEPMGKKQVYDLTIPETHNFVSNDICVHNTALCLNVAQHVALEKKLPVAVFSLEMSKEQLVQRMLCSEAGIDATRLRTGQLQNNDWTRLSMAMGRLGEAPVFIDDSAVVTALEIRAKCRRLKAEQKNLGLIVIDYIQLMQGRKATDNRVQEVSEISRSLKTLARELEVPVIALSQLSRAVEARQNKRPMLSDLRESGSIEQDADIVMFIYRDDYYNAESDRRGEAEVIIAKQRNGPTGTVDLLFQSTITRFLNKIRQNPNPDYSEV